MKGVVVCLLFLIFLFFYNLNGYTANNKDDSFFKKSLHSTAGGMSFWYSKNNGGLETLTDIPYNDSRLDCVNCHISSCDRCHKIEKGRKLYYSVENAKKVEICLACHKREKAILDINSKKNEVDVHTLKNFKCFDCHSSSDIHGDGNEYESMKQEGVINIHCEDCHSNVKPSLSHNIHGEKLECKACHISRVVSCTNCHIDTIVKEKKRVDIKVTDWVFLINYNGKVTSGNMQNFVVSGNKTFLLFAPQNSHSIKKEGRKCNECHGTEVVRQLMDGRLRLTWLENGEVKNQKGIIPVVEDVLYEAVYQDYQDGKWIPIKDPFPAKIQYAGYGKPLSKEQLKRLSREVIGN